MDLSPTALLRLYGCHDRDEICRDLDYSGAARRLGGDDADLGVASSGLPYVGMTLRATARRQSPRDLGMRVGQPERVRLRATGRSFLCSDGPGCCVYAVWADRSEATR